MPSRSTILATIDIAERLKLLPVPERVHSLAVRIEKPRCGVAIVGLQSRGKSTLVNDLVGAPVSAVRARSETAASIAMRTGEPSATGITRAGSRVTLPPSPSDFASAAQRSGELEIVEAEIAGQFRLPADVILIDTPGIDDAAMDHESALAGLGDQWIRSGAGAALVLLSVPPGLAAQDRRLIERARDVFPGGVSVAMKRTSASVGQEDFEEVASYAADVLNCPVLQVPEAPSPGAWGQTELRGLESEMAQLAALAASRFDADVAAFERFVELLTAELTDTSLADLSTLDDALANVGQAAPPSLVAAMQQRRHRLLEDQEQRAAAELARVDEQRHAVANQSAARLIDAAASSIRTNQTGTAKPIFGELLELSRSGSPVAIDAVATLLINQGVRTAAEVELGQVLASLPESTISESWHKLAATTDDLIGALRAELPAATRSAVEHLALQWCMQAKAALDDLSRLAHLARDPLVRDQAAEMEGSRRVDHVDRTVRQPFTDLFAYWAQVYRAVAESDAWRIQQADRASMTEVLAASDQRMRQLNIVFAQRAAVRLQALLRAQYTGPVDNVDTWDSETSSLEKSADDLLAIDPNTAELIDLKTDVELSRSSGRMWASTAHRAVEDAKLRATRTQTIWRAVYFGSFGLWFVACSQILTSPQSAFWIWIGAIVLWRVAAARTEGPPQWESHLTLPASPLS